MIDPERFPPRVSVAKGVDRYGMNGSKDLGVESM